MLLAWLVDDCETSKSNHQTRFSNAFTDGVGVRWKLLCREHYVSDMPRVQVRIGASVTRE